MLLIPTTKNTMKKPTNSWKIAASLALAASLAWADTASATLTVSTANENNAAAFTPTWPVATGAANLIAGLLPTDSFGNFTQESAGGTSKLTDGAIGPVTGTTIFATCGNNGGRMAIYDLPAAAANGYNITNITTFTGWGNGGRHAQAYTLYYSTKANPRNWILLGSVVYSGGFTGNNPNNPSANRVMWTDSVGAPIANNVAAIMFDFNTPTSPNGYNGYCGYSEITVEGTASATVVTQVVTIAKSNLNGANPFNPAWALEAPSLIAGMIPTSTNGNFNLENQLATITRDIASLTANGDQTITLLPAGPGYGSTTSPNYLTCGGGSGSCSTIIYTLTNSPINGSDVTNIVVYNGWADSGRHGQYYTVSYSTVAAPSTYLPISTVYYLPTVPGGTPSANRVAITATNGVPLASAVANVRFDFATPPAAGAFNNGYQGYSQIIVQGKDTTAPPPPPTPVLLQDTLPIRAETFVGDQVVFTTAYSNFPPVSLQWQQIVSGPVTNNINTGVVNVTNNNVVTSTLTLNNVQLGSAGTYRVKADNATNGAAAPSYTTVAPLAVSTPTTVGNVLVKNTGQVGPASFYPAWSIDTNIDLIFGFPTDGSGNPGTAAAGAGNYALEVPLNGDPTILADGVLSSDRTKMVSCGWVNVGAGQSMTYTLPAGPSFGYEITNITVYGGWPDDGRNQQKYQVLYSTFSAPSTFVSIGTFDYNPSFSDGNPNSTRVILVPLNGVLAHNVAAVQINFNMQSKNNWNGYSEVTINGTASLGVIPTLTQDITPLTAEDVVGSALTMTAAFSGATSFQWQKNGTNIPGATAATLTLSNLQFSDTATNGGYRLLGINVAGTNMSRGCSLVVNPAPVATNNQVTAFAIQTSDSSALNPFSPTWDTTSLGASLIAGQNPPSLGNGPGNFNDPDVNFPGSAGGLPILTDGNYGTFAYDGSHPAFAAAGPTAGQFVTYTLGANANGYSITNIQIAGGWNDNGRDSQYYTILYSTVANTNVFLPLASVAKSLVGYGANNSTTIRTTITPATGVLASNVYAIQVDFQFPEGVPNGYSGYSEISIFGAPSVTAPPAGPVITAEHEEVSNIWTVETPNLIANQLPTSQGTGVFTQEGCNVTNLTDGAIGFGFQFAASCGADGVSVPYIVFNSAYGWNLTNIVVYTLWHDYGRDGQFYNVSYSTLSAPTTFLPLASVAYNPFVPHDGTDSGNRVNIAPAIGQATLATNVAAVKFDFTPQGSQDFGWSGYSEIVLQGSNLPGPPQFNPPYISGGNLILTGTGAPGSSYSLLTSTNVAAPISAWTTNVTGVINGSGVVSNAIPVSVSERARFFRLKTP